MRRAVAKADQSIQEEVQGFRIRMWARGAHGHTHREVGRTADCVSHADSVTRRLLQKVECIAELGQGSLDGRNGAGGLAQMAHHLHLATHSYHN